MAPAGNNAMRAEIIRRAAEGWGDDRIARHLSSGVTRVTRHCVRTVLTEKSRSPSKGTEAKEISIDQILVLNGRRAAATNKVETMAESIDSVGRLLNPIIVRERQTSTGFILVAGRHRIEAFRLLGRHNIPAFVMPASTTEAEARMWEIAENLHRAELTALERSQQIAEWRQLAKARKLSDPSNHQPHELGNSQTARELGIDEKAVRDAVKIAENITPEAAEAAREAGIDDNQSKLLKVAAEAPERQVGAVHKLSGARAIMASRVEPDDSLDFFATPPWATRALMERVFPHLGIVPSGVFWEPAAGEGHMSCVLAEYGQVHATDIHNYGPHLDAVCDFLNEKSGAVPDADWIVTNPPFADKTVPFVLRALELAKTGVAMFVRLQWLEGIERYKSIFCDRSPTWVCPFAERVNLCKGRWDPDGTTATAYSWLVWLKDRAPAPAQMFWVPPGCREALTKPEDRARYAGWSMPNGDDARPIKVSSEPPRITVAEAMESILRSRFLEHPAAVEHLMRRLFVKKLGRLDLSKAAPHAGETAVRCWNDFLSWCAANGLKAGDGLPIADPRIVDIDFIPAAPADTRPG